MDAFAKLPLAALLLAFALLPAQFANVTPAWAQSAIMIELDKHFNQYQALKKKGKYREAIVHAKKVLELGEREFGTKHKTYATSLNHLAGLYKAQGRYGEAEPLYKRSLTIYEAARGKNHTFVAATLNNLATLYEAQGRYGEAEPLFKRALTITEAARGKNHPFVATSLNNLAALYEAQGRYGEAEPLFRRSLTIREAALGKHHPSLATTLNNLAALYEAQGRYAQAEPLYKRSLTIYEAARGKNHPFVATSLNNLAALYETQGRYDEADPLYKRSLTIRETALGKHHPFVATSLNNLAALYEAQGRYGEAEPHLKRALTILEAALGKHHPFVATSLNNLAFLHFDQRDWRRAAAHWRRASAVLTRRAAYDGQIGPNKKGQRVRGKKKTEVAQNSWYFRGLVKSVFRHDDSHKAGREMFQSAQWAMQSQAAGALAQMSARQAAGSGELAKMVRERQDKVSAWQSHEKRMNALRGAGKSDKKLEADMAKIDKRLAQIDKRLAKEFPDYAALASPKPLNIKQVQKLLGPGEALILLLDTPKAKPTPAETFIWAVTRDKAIWKRAELGGKTLSAKVALLRSQLDPSTATRSSNDSRGFVAVKKGTGFSLQTAHELYEKLLGPVEKLIRDKRHLMIVASGPLTALPFQVLLRSRPKPATSHQQADWLIHHHAITTLPSVSSLKALRGIDKETARAPNPLIGFADPEFWKASAKPVQMASIVPKKRAVMRSYQSFFRGRNADLATLAQSLPQLEGTRRELLEIGKVLKIDKANLIMGRAASERAVKEAKLDQFRIVYFATHGLIAGDVEGLGEPALAFSLPAKARPLDDGLLTASEVTTLKLNADWLVMSACNTASGEKPGAEALSGLARAFFYAGAKTLLVSHWPVGDEAAVKLTTHAFKNMQANPKLGRSQALRRSMLAMIDTGGASAHPTNWAPFVIVGEGGAGR